jgi:cyclophilin family peptidyl-prolyl cis-trans isomerase/predicted DsbA family dithiol-disulfide isomerase
LDAAISFLVYCDFQSPPCAELTRNLDTLREIHPDDVQLIYRQFPLLVLNDKAGLAAELALAANAQDAFWAMHDRLYREQQTWTDFSEDEFIDWAGDTALDIGLDGNQIEADLRNDVYAKSAQDAFVNGVNSGLPGTPFLLLNGEWFHTSPTLTNLEAAIRLEMLSAMQFEEPPDLQIGEDALYLARIELNTGDLIIQLFPDAAPASVANFIFLAQQGWFDDTIFHRVVPGSYVEAGDPTATGFGSPGYFLRDEIDSQVGFDRAGRIAMASAGPDTNGSMFAITLRSLPEWDGTRTIFGQVIEGLSLLSDLEAREPLDDLLLEPDTRIITIEIEEQ